jgi:4-diphosphocytidyl-2-C-methyl-D-erythritol kinase
MRAPAFAKINLGLVVGGLRPDGKHELATVLERIDLHDVVEVERVERREIVIEGFAEDTLVRSMLARFAEQAGTTHGWRVRIEKRIPLSSGLGGGSSDAATAVRLANELVDEPLSPPALHDLAAHVGSDVPFFLTPEAKLATGSGTTLEVVALPRAYWAVLVVPHGQKKESTAAVYGAVDAAAAGAFFERNRQALLDALSAVRAPRDLGKLPQNALFPDTRTSPHGAELVRHGAFRVDRSGAGPTLYGLFDDAEDAQRAKEALSEDARTWLARPVFGP